MAGSCRTIGFVIDGRLPQLNEYIRVERGNRYAAAKLKREWTEIVAWQARAAGLKPVEHPVRVLCTWYTHDKRADPDNVAWAKKMILDGLVDAGVLPNDSRRWVIGFADEFETDRQRPRVEVRLEAPC